MAPMRRTPKAAVNTPTTESEPAAAAGTLTPTPPLAPSAIADPSAPPPDAPASAAAAGEEPNAATTKKVRKIIKKVIVKKIVPKGTLAARKAAAASAALAETAKLAEEPPAEKPASDSDAGSAAEAPAEEPVASADANGSAVGANWEVGTVDGVEEPEVSERQKRWRAEVGEVGRVDGVEETEVSERQKRGRAEVGEVGRVDGVEETEVSERQKRRRTEVFVGGLDRDAKEEDVSKVFAKAGEIAEVRMMRDAQTGKNKGYCFVRYREAAQAKKAIAEFSKVEICGKQCGAAALEGNDRIFLGNIDKKWTKEDIIKLLQEIGVENIDTVILMTDINNPGCNRGFAFLELETNRDAQLAYKKLTKKDVFGKGLNVKVSWAEPFNEPDEEQMQKVKSIFVEGIPTSWDQAKLTEIFNKYGIIERVVLSRNIQSAKRKDFAFVNYTTREAAILCLESFDKEELTENGSKVNLTVSLAKPALKGKQNKGGQKFSGSEKDKPNIVQSKPKVARSSGRVMSSRVDQTVRDKKSTTTHELLHVLREQAAWRQGHTGYSSGPAIQDYSSHKRAFSALGNDSLYPGMRGHPRPRYENSSSYPTATPSYGGLPHANASGASSRQYYHSQGNRYPADSYYKMAEPSSTSQARQAVPRQAGLRKGGPPYWSRQHQ